MGFKPVSSTTGEPSVMNEAEESKQPPVRHLQLPGQNGTSQALLAYCQGRGWMGSCHPAHQSKKPSPRAAPALMLVLHYTQTAPNCKSTKSQLRLRESCFSPVAGRDAYKASGRGESRPGWSDHIPLMTSKSAGTGRAERLAQA